MCSIMYVNSLFIAIDAYSAREIRSECDISVQLNFVITRFNHYLSV